MRLARAVWLALMLVPATVAGQNQDAAGDWRFFVRATLSGNSAESSPDGYVIYSGLAIEGAIARDLTDMFAIELSLRTESREVDGPETLPEPALGSLEALPVSLTLKWQPRGGSGTVFQPYAGAGLNMTYVWEKSGALDSTDPPIALNPVGQLGADLVLSPRFRLTLDVKWHPLDVEMKGLAAPAPKVTIDPLILGAGFGFAF
jgi:outer membrane protein W